MNIPQSSSITDYPLGISVQATVKVPSPTVNDEFLFGAWGNRGIFLLYIDDDDKLEFDVDTQNAFVEIDFSSYFNQWVNIAAVYDNYSSKIYINGELVVEGEIYYSTIYDMDTYNGGDFTIGRCNENCSVYPGSAEVYFYEAAIWNIPLDEDNINNNFHHGISSADPGLVGYWDFNQNVNDQSPNANHGALMGNPQYSTDVPIFGCTDSEACNYDPDANWDDGSCEYVEDCAGECGGSAYEDACGVCGGDNSSCPTVTDIDENVYNTIQIGNQNWMQQNLKTTHYRNGVTIPTDLDNSDWSIDGAYAIYDDDPVNAEIYGNLYNWYAVDDDRGICPEGWHVPTDIEWTVLSDYLGGESVAGGKMKETGLEHWNYYSDEITEETTNESEFTGLPGGYRNSSSYFDTMGDVGSFWSFTDTWRWYLNYNESSLNKASQSKQNGYSVRCLETIEGCTDSYAEYFDESANVDDGSCTYPDNGDYSLQFDGDDDYAIIDLLDNITQNDSYSIAFWFKLGDNQYNNTNHFLIEGSTYSSPGIEGWHSNSLQTFSFIVNQGPGIPITDLITDTFYHLICTWNETTSKMRVYLNGQKIGTDTSYTDDDINALYLARREGDSNYLSVIFEDLLLFPSSLEDNEALSLYDNSLDLDLYNLKGYYKFNAGTSDTLYDHSGNQNHGTIYGATWAGCTDPLADNYNPGAIVDDGSCICSICDDYSLSFDGVDDYVDVPNLGQLSDFTVELFIKNEQIYGGGNRYGGIFGTRDWGSGKFAFQIIGNDNDGWQGGELSVEVAGGSRVISQTNFHSDALNVWTHFAVTYEADDTMKLFINGILEHDSTATNVSVALTQSSLGDLHTWDERHFDGAFDEFRIWNVIRTQEEIQSNMYSELTGNEDGLLVYWDFNQQVNDQSGNGNDGTLMNMDDSSWVLNTYGCSTEPDACNYEEGGNFDNQICLYDDCEGECGGDSWEDNCGVCYGDNSTCDIQSTEMSAYYFSSVTLNGMVPNDDVEIEARNEESGMVVGSGTYGNVGGGITEVLVYGEMGEDFIVNTDGLMSPGETPQFYVGGDKAHYVAADGTILQEIPPFESFQFYIDLTLHLETDCNDDMGGSAFSDSCGICSGGESGHEADSDIDDCGVCLGENEDQDCNGDCFGEALGDSCDVCSGGESGHEADSDIDCNGDCFGEALEDSCDVCSGGNSDHTANSDQDCNGDCCGGTPNDVAGCGATDDVCGICSGGNSDHEADSDQDCAGECFGDAVIDNCGVCDGDYNNNCYDLEIILDGNANLISFPALPGDGDYLVENIFGSLGDNLNGVFGEGRAFVNWPGNGLIGSLTEVAQDEGYWVILNTFPDTLVIDGAVPVSYDGLDNFGEPCTDCNNGEVIYDMHDGNNLISYPFQTPQSLDDALGEAADNVYALAEEGIAALNCDNYDDCNEDWIGSLAAFEGSKGYWLIAIDDFDFTFNEPEENLARIAHQPAVRPVPEAHRFMQSSRQAFYFIESATIYGKVLDIDDIIIAYNGDVVVGSRYWNGEYTDVPAMGMDDYNNIEGYCKSGDRISFKVWDASINELIDMETDIETAWHDLSMAVINITEVLPDDFSLDRAYPNPFNPVTTLRFALPLESEVSLTIYNLQGREVVSLINGNMPAGYHSVVWNADRNSSGVYFVKMVAGEYVNTQKLMLVK